MVEQYNDPERMDRLEAQVEKAMTKFETQLEKALARMEAKMDTWQANFVTKELLEEKLKARDEKIERLEEEKSANKHTLPLWTAVVISAVALIYSFWPKK